jgi:hypothetical protein
MAFRGLIVALRLLVAFFMVRVMRIMSAIGAQAWEKLIN